jgi:hypothetical protein
MPKLDSGGGGGCILIAPTHGTNELSNEKNVLLIKTVAQYIKITKRFT